ncbi:MULTISPECIES: hypothetical protein [Mesoplasma]|uniref:Uncharacterized protein n=1 Tax=Mesoplasma florum TaxID=2151 RepID=A0A2R3P7M8_MESFO|nr:MULTISPECIES: hypothetical protein [Mesoplasma]AVN64500.1 hypothetical protein CG003_02395 [Mesoplasma florum]
MENINNVFLTTKFLETERDFEFTFGENKTIKKISATDFNENEFIEIFDEVFLSIKCMEKDQIDKYLENDQLLVEFNGKIESVEEKFLSKFCEYLSGEIKQIFTFIKENK